MTVYSFQQWQHNSKSTHEALESTLTKRGLSETTQNPNYFRYDV